jgi:putative addiction module component (TIGR02574 family)
VLGYYQSSATRTNTLLTADFESYSSTMIDESLLAKVSSLSPADRLELIGVVWDTLSPNDLPVTDAERALLDARLADMERNPDDQSPWPEVKARLERLSR